MNNRQKILIVKIIMATIIVGLILSIKTIVLINLEQMGITSSKADDIREYWSSPTIEYIFLVLAVIASGLIVKDFHIR